jgi:hypothetical protein
MLLNDLMDAVVVDAAGHRLGRVIDARFRLEGGRNRPRARLLGLVVSPRSASSYLGYERKAASRPVIIDRFLRWRHRGSFLVRWADVAQIDADPRRVRLRKGFTREDPQLESRDS